ncbi:hypothetical protein PoB_000279600 [Plakobranchus ocellatus]|uniref:Uncharacterized protein n=1 Tax=Plakobranchus ocellatus TaxID=259542 RepID=A0AAV3XZN2_9GAST|nr:hypothetical protein PoB_000279600 [Plakobranchus ocellatus]
MITHNTLDVTVCSDYTQHNRSNDTSPAWSMPHEFVATQQGQTGFLLTFDPEASQHCLPESPLCIPSSDNMDYKQRKHHGPPRSGEITFYLPQGERETRRAVSYQEA